MGSLGIVLFLLLAVYAQRVTWAKKYSFSLIVLAAVSAAMSYPALFTQIGDFKLNRLIIPLLQIIMFGMGTAMSIKDFTDVIKMPQAVGVGLVCQFSIMPIIGYTIARFFAFPPEIAAGIILVGTSPSGLASNVMAYLARANLALSVTLTSCATLLAPFVTPYLMELLAGELVAVNTGAMMLSMIKIVIIPVVAGVIFNYFFHGRAGWLDRSMPIISMIGIALIITVITAAGRDSLIEIGILLILAAVIHNLLGYALGYICAKMIRLEEKDCRSIALEVGMQNSGLASGLALEMGKLATVGLAPAVFGPWMNISGSALASWWRERDTQPTLQIS